MEVRSWKKADRRGGNGLLEKIWSDASNSLQSFLSSPNQGASQLSATKSRASNLRDNRGLIEAALADLRGALGAMQSLPRVKIGDGCVIPRAFSLAVAFLRAAEFRLTEVELVAFLTAVEETHSLMLCEFWMLKSLFQLALLQEIAQVVNARPSPGKGPAERAFLDEASSLQIAALIAALHAMNCAPWKEVQQKVCKVEQILREDPSATYPQMDAESRDLYLREVQHLGRYSRCSEAEIARWAVLLAKSNLKAKGSEGHIIDRRTHVGFYLIDSGRERLEQQIHYRPPFAERVRAAILASPEPYYFVGIELLTFAIIAFLLIGARSPVSVIVGVILLLLPATEAAWGVINQLLTSNFPPRILPKLNFSGYVPPECSTMVVVPTLLLNDGYVRRLVKDLEIRYLANSDPNIFFALLTDAPDSPRPSDRGDELVSLCSKLIESLNRKYAHTGRFVFFLFHRFRTFNPLEGFWMGWERKRGKLLEFNELLRGQMNRFPVRVGDLGIVPKIKYVITLDSDTQLPRGAARKLIATIAHPLNRAAVNARTNTVVRGYGIIQPRVGISVRSARRSLLANIYSGQAGFDLYTHATSNVYQDLFGEGSFTGKGIYEVDVFRQVLGKRLPCNAILSHDLLEGAYLRVGLASDIEVIDDYPTHFSAYSRRKHRWLRGDWQIMQWLFSRVPDAIGKRVANPLSSLSRWKILDNLRRSLVEVATFILFLAGWLSLPGSPRRWTLVVLVLMLIPAYFQLVIVLLKELPRLRTWQKLKEISESFVADQINLFFVLAFLSYQALTAIDAILRTIVRVTITRNKLLEWETAAQAEVEMANTPLDLYLAWTPWLSLALAVTLLVIRPAALAVAAPLLLLWASAGPLARWLNRPLPRGKSKITDLEERFLRSASLCTWRYLRQSLDQSPVGLIPDNIQEAPARTAHRISPTNLGLLLNSQLAAHELGYLTLPEFVANAEKTLSTVKRFQKFRGHLLNWYDTETLEPLEPRFVSSVDSGNLVCSLWALKQGCLKAAVQPLLRRSTWQGLRDHFNLLEELARQASQTSVATLLRRTNARIELLPDQGLSWLGALPGLEQDLHEIAEWLDEKSSQSKEIRWWLFETLRRITAIRNMIAHFIPWFLPQNRHLEIQRSIAGSKLATEPTLRSAAALAPEMEAITRKLSTDPSVDPILHLTATTLRERLTRASAEAEKVRKKLAQMANDVEELVGEMDFRFLYNSSRKLLSLGYSVEQQTLREECYDLLASEARSAVFAAIAKDDIPEESWFQLGRKQGVWDGEGFLLSWSGTMFEYLMPTLWFNQYAGTILGESARVAVQCQRDWATNNSLPWGISEAAYCKQDLAGNYQYRAFGVPALGLDPNPSQDVVVAPYASFLGLAIDPQEAVRNLQRLTKMGCLGQLGFYDSVDFSNTLENPRPKYKVVRCWMAHHQGMSLVAACNLLADGAIQNLFHSEPAVCATELLLHEKLVSAVDFRRVGVRAARLRGAGFRVRKFMKDLATPSTYLDLESFHSQRKMGKWRPSEIPPHTSLRN